VISSRNPMKDSVAFAGAATTGFVARNSGRSQASLAAEACTKVLRECGLGPSDVDSICGSSPAAPAVQSMLGIPEVTWFANPLIPFVNQVTAAASAVYSGLCDVVLAYHAAYRLPWNTSASLKDPFRRGGTIAPMPTNPGPETIAGAVGYTAWASRYLHDYGVPREHFGFVAINDRSNAAANPAAAVR
jgi:hypothetical protein